MQGQMLPVPTDAIRLMHELRGHTDSINRVVWSPNGRGLASASFDHTVRLWDTVAGCATKTFEGHQLPVYGIAWSPDGSRLASGSQDCTVRVWSVQTAECHILTGHGLGVYCVGWSPCGRWITSGDLVFKVNVYDADSLGLIRVLEKHEDDVSCVEWSPNGRFLATGSDDRTVVVWDAETFAIRHMLKRHEKEVSSAAWSPDSKLLATGSLDCTIGIWNPESGRLKMVLEGAMGQIKWVAFSNDGQLLASRSSDGLVWLWDCETWKPIANIPVVTASKWEPTLAFNPKASQLATSGESVNSIRIWSVDSAKLLAGADSATANAKTYRSAKVVIVGEHSSGKTGLWNALMGRSFRETVTTHARSTGVLPEEPAESKDSESEHREICLWDLAGQADYRLIHQLSLDSVSVALVVFDAFNSPNPLDCVLSWDRALQLANRGNTALKKLLVSARIDLRGEGQGQNAIELFRRENGFEGYYPTSSKCDIGITELRSAIRGAIDWYSVPETVNDERLGRVKEYVATESRYESQLIQESTLCTHFMQSRRAISAFSMTRKDFRLCLDNLDAHGVIRRLPFGDLILLQPEVLDKYASALVLEAKNDPSGLGCLSEDRVRSGEFKLDLRDRIEDRQQESLLLIAVVETLLQHELAFRLPTDNGTMLVFPTQLTRDLPLKNPIVTYTFDGPVNNVYATLSVRLVYSGLFRSHETWRNAFQFYDSDHGKYGLRLHEIGQGKAQLDLTAFDTKQDGLFDSFDRFVFDHLRKRAIPESIRRKRHFVCSACNTGLTPDQIEGRQNRGFNVIDCPVCGAIISIVDNPPESSPIEQLSRQAVRNRDRQIGESMIEGKTSCGFHDVFLAYNSHDRERVKSIYHRLLDSGIRAWFDAVDLRPGTPWVSALPDILLKVKSAAVFVGSNGPGRWEKMEIDLLLKKFVESEVRVIPVLLEGAINEPNWNAFLDMFHCVDFRTKNPDAFEQLVFGITGKNPGAQV